MPPMIRARMTAARRARDDFDGSRRRADPTSSRLNAAFGAIRLVPNRLVNRSVSTPMFQPGQYPSSLRRPTIATASPSARASGRVNVADLEPAALSREIYKEIPAISRDNAVIGFIG